MSNVVEFVLRMRDMMSNSMATAAQNAQRRLREVENAADRIPQSFNRQSGAMGNAGTSLGRIFKGNFLATIGTELISGITGLVSQAGNAIVGGLFNKQRAIAGLETFLGAQGASELYKQIQQDAAATPFGTEGLLEVNKALVSAGLSAKEARQDTLALANAISATGGSNAELARMAANMQQIKTVGVATATDIKQFGMAGINIYQILADATGKNIEQVKEMSVSYDLLSMALQKASEEGGIYFGAMDRYSKTLPGMWDAFKEGLATTATDIGEKLAPSIGAIMEMLLRGFEYVNGLLGTMQPVFDWINNAITGIANGTSEWYGWIETILAPFEYLWGMVKWIYSGIGSIVGGIIDWVKRSELLKDVFSTIAYVAQWIVYLVGNLIEGLKIVWENVLKPILDGIEMAYRWVKELLGGTVSAAVAVKDTSAATPEAFAPTGAFTPTNFSGGGAGGAGGGISSRGVTAQGPKTISVNISKVIEKLEINSMNIREGVGEMENLITEHVYRALISLETAN